MSQLWNPVAFRLPVTADGCRYRNELQSKMQRKRLRKERERGGNKRERECRVTQTVRERLIQGVME